MATTRPTPQRIPAPAQRSTQPAPKRQIATQGHSQPTAKAPVQGAKEGFLSKVKSFLGISPSEFAPNAQFSTAPAPHQSQLQQLGHKGIGARRFSDASLIDSLDSIIAHGGRPVRAGV